MENIPHCEPWRFQRFWRQNWGHFWIHIDQRFQPDRLPHVGEICRAIFRKMREIRTLLSMSTSSPLSPSSQWTSSTSSPLSTSSRSRTSAVQFSQPSLLKNKIRQYATKREIKFTSPWSSSPVLPLSPSWPLSPPSRELPCFANNFFWKK